MRVFSVQAGGEFREYLRTDFKANHEETILEGWLESNPDGIVEDGKLLIIGRQVATDLGGFIDLLGVDRDGDVVVIELKRDRTPRDTIAQDLEYASFAERLDSNQLEAILQSYLNDASLSLAEYHREYFQLSSDEAVSFNKDQRIVVVGQHVTSEIRQTSNYLCSKGMKVTCVEFTFFQSDGGTKLLSQNIVAGMESKKPNRISTGSLPTVTKQDFFSSLDENGKAVFSKILEFAEQRSLPIHWGTKGFSLNVDLGGTHVAVCYGYPPECVFTQSVYTALIGRGGFAKKVAVTENMMKSLWDKAESTGLFKPAGRELKCLINRHLSEHEVSNLINWIDSVVETISEFGLKE